MLFEKRSTLQEDANKTFTLEGIRQQSELATPALAYATQVSLSLFLSLSLSLYFSLSLFLCLFLSLSLPLVNGTLALTKFGQGPN